MDRLVQAVANWENCFQKEWVVLREVGGRGNVKRVDGWVGYEDKRGWVILIAPPMDKFVQAVANWTIKRVVILREWVRLRGWVGGLY